MGRKIDSSYTSTTGPAGLPPMPADHVCILMDGEALWSGDADVTEAAAEQAGYAAECAPLVEWLRAGGEMKAWWPHRRLGRTWLEHVAAGGLPPLEIKRAVVA